MSLANVSHNGQIVSLFDRTASQWIRLDVPSLGGYPFRLNLFGADGDNLVFEYTLSAGFFRLVRSSQKRNRNNGPEHCDRVMVATHPLNESR
jgi:hypothetical protein